MDNTRPTELQLVKALQRLVDASREVFTDPGDFGPCTERCNQEFKAAQADASRLIRNYKRGSHE